MKTNRVYYLCGPTASGKTALSVQLGARIPNAVFINADTMQLYKSMGCLPSTPEKEELRGMGKHKLFKVLKREEECGRNAWLKMAKKEIKKALDKNKIPILVGGSRSFLSCLASAAYGMNLPVDQRVAPTFAEEEKVKKFPWELSSIVLMPDLNMLAESVRKDVERRAMASLAMIRKFVKSGKVDFTKPALQTIGVPELRAVVEGDITFNEAVAEMQRRTLRYAQEQVVLFNRFYEGIVASLGPSRAIKVDALDRQARVDEAAGFIEEKEKPISD